MAWGLQHLCRVRVWSFGEFLASFGVGFVFSNFIQKVCWGLLQPRFVAFCPRLPFRGESTSKKFRKPKFASKCSNW